ncbi:MAG: PadR family transcriptional regulator [Acholeplasmatales bacterium]|nr:PadR family transcriptional regulator [Acholeplasmatales bacterium]
MNVQLKRGLTDVCILAALRHGDSYGYKIISDLSDIMILSESTLYPVLKRLESQGLLSTYSKDYNGRLRKYYVITDSGIERIEGFLEEWKEMEKVGKFISGKVGA